MKTVGITLVGWLAGFAVWLLPVWAERESDWDWLTDVLLPAGVMGAPLLVVVPLVHSPGLRWLSRRTTRTGLRRMALIMAGVAFSLPLVFWPLWIGGGGWRDLWTVEAGQYALMYSVFGVVFGAMYKPPAMSPKR